MLDEAYFYGREYYDLKEVECKAILKTVGVPIPLNWTNYDERTEVLRPKFESE
jgi:hypothetical protein